MYVHPWELDPDQPRMNGPLLSRFRHYVNLHKTEERLIHLLKEFRFAPIREAIVPIRSSRDSEPLCQQDDVEADPNGQVIPGVFTSGFEDMAQAPESVQKEGAQELTN